MLSNGQLHETTPVGQLEASSLDFFLLFDLPNLLLPGPDQRIAPFTNAQESMYILLKLLLPP